jgi:hypothetical protein
VIAWAQHHGAPVHAHLSEQTAENLACLAAYRATPAEVLYDAGAVGPRTTVVHATHLASRDIELLGGSRACACFCPTTEADLADGIGPARALASCESSMLSLGTDSPSRDRPVRGRPGGSELGERLATSGAATSPPPSWPVPPPWPGTPAWAGGRRRDRAGGPGGPGDGRAGRPPAGGTSAATALESVIFAATAADVRDAGRRRQGTW